MAARAYQTARYRAFKRHLAESFVLCFWCAQARAVTPDHNPPVILGGGDDDLVPSCMKCQLSRGGKLGGALKRARRQERRTLTRPWPEMS